MDRAFESLVQLCIRSIESACSSNSFHGIFEYSSFVGKGSLDLSQADFHRRNARYIFLKPDFTVDTPSTIHWSRSRGRPGWGAVLEFSTSPETLIKRLLQMHCTLVQVTN